MAAARIGRINTLDAPASLTRAMTRRSTQNTPTPTQTYLGILERRGFGRVSNELGKRALETRLGGIVCSRDDIASAAAAAGAAAGGSGGGTTATSNRTAWATTRRH